MKTSYKTPPPKLARFFEKSRDTWKDRCHDKQQLIRKLRVNVRDLTLSRERWKAEALRARQQLRQRAAQVQETSVGG